MTNYLIRRNNLHNYDLFDEALSSFFKPMRLEEKNGLMKTDVRESEKEYLMDVEVPGFEKNEIALSFEKGYLTISAEKKENTSDNEKFLRKERSYHLSRTYYLGEVNKDAIKAKYENGVLQIVIPKKEKEIDTAHNILID
jgi:HSP20 family protein